MLGLLIFDMDGTLINAMELHAHVFSQILYDRFAIPIEVSKTEYFKSAGNPLDEQFKHVISLMDQSIFLNLDELLENFWTIIENTNPILFSDVFDGLTTLWNAGYQLAITSGCSPHVVEYKLKATGIIDYFSIRLGTDRNIPQMVKGEGHFKIIRSHYGISLSYFQSNTAIVGDSNYDMKLGLEAGILPIGRVTHNNASELKRNGGSFVINNLNDLIIMLKAKGESFVSINQLAELSRKFSSSNWDK